MKNLLLLIILVTLSNTLADPSADAPAPQVPELTAEDIAAIEKSNRIKELKKRLRKLKHKRWLMRECGYSASNIKLFMDKVAEDEDMDKVLCLESNRGLVGTLVQQDKDKETKRQWAKNYMKAQDCDSKLLNYDKAVCILLKGR